MNSKEIRKAFLDFFESKGHRIIPSDSIVLKNDPTLMFTNAGMNQFKDIFLGNIPPTHNRVADTQKCLRVSGKHNDLEEVGIDTYHHTMFEMLGNWSFGDYFKAEAIEWGWEFLTVELKIPAEKLYATVFEGSKDDGIEPDSEAFAYWKKFLPDERIIYGSKKDNFWEMGASGPCGPCSEIHIDMRDDSERKNVNGSTLINKNHPLVIEIWNLVFIQYNRKTTGELELLPSRHVDTGMGFERLCMVANNRKSNYDTDIFVPLIKEISVLSEKEYGAESGCDVAMRVVADHLRAVAFSIADGQLPSNTGAGYVIRRILRRAVRYGYSYLEFKEPFMFKLIQVLTSNMGYYFTELASQQKLIENVIREEELSFLKTLETGIKKFDDYLVKEKQNLLTNPVISGKFTFTLYDTYGFPLDLTQVLAKENNLSVDVAEFENCLKGQRERSRNAAVLETGEWSAVATSEKTVFTGYDTFITDSKIIKYRKVTQKGKTNYQLVLDRTPFYAESGGQCGDTGTIEWNGQKFSVIDTKKDNNLIIHILENLPEGFSGGCIAAINETKRRFTEQNHSATHLLHYALRTILGTHVEQKGSFVNDERLRFDFTHFQKMSEEEIEKTEEFVNNLIQNRINMEEIRDISLSEAKKSGALALFGEKYEENVRVVSFGKSKELCGGTHVPNTGFIGIFKITSETSIAAGVRRIEALTGKHALGYLDETENTLFNVRDLLKNPKDIVKAVESVISENNSLSKKIKEYQKEKAASAVEDIIRQVKIINGINAVICRIDVDEPELLREISFATIPKVEDLFLLLSAEIGGKAHFTLALSESIVKNRNMDAGKIIRTIAAEAGGSGGGQPAFATAGGTMPQNLGKALKKAEEILLKSAVV